MATNKVQRCPLCDTKMDIVTIGWKCPACRVLMDTKGRSYFPKARTLPNVNIDRKLAELEETQPPEVD